MKKVSFYRSGYNDCIKSFLTNDAGSNASCEMIYFSQREIAEQLGCKTTDVDVIVTDDDE